jgi:hypothetical protein
MRQLFLLAVVVFGVTFAIGTFWMYLIDWIL